MKYTIKKTTDFKRVITACYQTDPELYEHFHVLAPTTLEAAIEHTVDTFNKSLSLGAFTMYEILNGGETIGYFGKETSFRNEDLLHGMFILPEYRTREFVVKFWRMVRSKFKNTIYCAAYNKNQRFCKFISKKGFTFVGEVFIPHEKQYAQVFKL